MRAILSLTLIILIATFGMAQTNSEELKVKTVAKEVKLDSSIEKNSNEKLQVARLYLNKNSRIKKELKFKTKRTRAKMA